MGNPIKITMPVKRYHGLKSNLWTDAEICEQLNCAPSTLTRWKARNGILPPRQKIPPEDVPMLYQRYKNGETLSQIAKDYNCTKVGIGCAIRKYRCQLELNRV